MDYYDEVADMMMKSYCIPASGVTRTELLEALKVKFKTEAELRAFVQDGYDRFMDLTAKHGPMSIIYPTTGVEVRPDGSRWKYGKRIQ